MRMPGAPGPGALAGGRRWRVLVAAAAAGLAGVLLLLMGPVVRDARVTPAGGAARPVTLPYAAPAAAGAVASFHLTVWRGPFAQTWQRVTPDGCVLAVRVNGLSRPLTGLEPAALCNSYTGFLLPLGRWLRAGENDVEVTVANGKGSLGLSILPANVGALRVAVLLLLLLAAMVLLAEILASLGFTRALVAVVLLGLLVRVAYLAVTPWDLRGHDVESHLRYVAEVARSGALPRPGGGFEFFQPPLYYLVAAGLFRLLEPSAGANLAVVYRGLQLLALLFNLVFVVAGVEILRTSLGVAGRRAQRPGAGRGRAPPAGARGDGSGAGPHRPVVLLAAALLTFWPANVVHSVRIGNDPPLYALFGVALLFLVRWDLEQRPRDLWLAGFATALALLTKASAAAAAGALAVTVLLHLVRPRGRDRSRRALLRQAALVGLLVAAATTVVVWRGGMPVALGGGAGRTPGYARTLRPGLTVGNGLHSYLTFDAARFVTVPFTSPWADTLGREQFWYYLGKTALFGEFWYQPRLAWGAAVVLSGLLLALVALTVAGVPLLSRSTLARHRVHLLTAGLLLVTLLALRVSIPASCHNDFRFVLPVLAPFSVLTAAVLLELRRRGWRALFVAGCALTGLFVLASVVFVAGLYA